MKCIKAVRETKYYRLGEIRRTNDVDAEEKVASGVWTYIPKMEWKAATRTKVEEPVVEAKEVKQLSISEKQLRRNKKHK